jgi:hypothetical protein
LNVGKAVICGRPLGKGFDGLIGLVGFGHMSGLLARAVSPLALMISDSSGPSHGREFRLVTVAGCPLPSVATQVDHHVSELAKLGLVFSSLSGLIRQALA